MASNFTPPDPLNTNAKTLSIYLTELQVCVNTRKAEIAQVAVLFISQNVDQKMRLDAIEELKTLTAQLALDFGYAGGIFHVDLLGRDWIPISKAKGISLASFPIINDLRLVLGNLVVQTTGIFGTVIWDWWDNGVPGIVPLAAYNGAVSDPWPNIPNLVQTGQGTTCPQGPPTCDNTITGSFKDTVIFATDKSILTRVNPISGPDFFQEGPIGGSYFTVSSSVSDVIAFANALVAVDENKFYSHGGSFGTGGEIYTAPRDGSVLRTLLGDFGTSFLGGRLGVTTDSVIMIAELGAGNLLSYGRMNKSSGAITTLVTGIGFQDLLGVGGTPTIVKINWGGGFVRGADIYLLYGEAYHDGDLNNRLHTVASAILKINPSGVVSVHSDLQSLTFLQVARVPSDPVFYRWHHGSDSQTSINTLTRGNSSGFYYRINADSSVIKVGLPSPPQNGTPETFNGTVLGSLDYKGDTLLNHNNIVFAENYLDHAPVTANIAPIDYNTAVRVSGVTTDTVDVTWTPAIVPTIVFRYRLELRLLGNPIWSINKTIESSDPLVGAGTLTGLDKLQSHFVRLVLETPQGLIISNEVSVPLIPLIP